MNPTPDIARTRMPTPNQPLAGIRVVDLSRYLPGPFCTLQLAWLGADVTVIERAPGGDPMRLVPPIGSSGVSLASTSLLQGKESMLLDFAIEHDREAARDLLSGADVVVEGFRPGVATRLGFGYDELAIENPALVYCSLTGYGQTGPWAQVPGHDANYEAVSGLLARTGTPHAPQVPALPFADLAGGSLAATAICAALVAAQVTGSGSHIDISLTEAALAWQAHALPAAATADATRQGGLLSGALATYRVYRCAGETFVAVAPIESKFFARLCELLGLDDLTSRQYDPSAQGDICRQLEAVFLTRTADEWHDLLAVEETCVTRVYEGDSFTSHPQHAARKSLRELPDDPGTFVPASPFVINGTRSDRR